MAHTFDELVEMQKSADAAHGRVLELRDTYGQPTTVIWTVEQTEAYETAWQRWRNLAEEVQAAVTEHAKEKDETRFGVEAAVRTKARHPQPEQEPATA